MPVKGTPKLTKTNTLIQQICNKCLSEINAKLNPFSAKSPLSVVISPLQLNRETQYYLLYYKDITFGEIQLILALDKLMNSLLNRTVYLAHSAEFFAFTLKISQRKYPCGPSVLQRMRLLLLTEVLQCRWKWCFKKLRGVSC